MIFGLRIFKCIGCEGYFIATKGNDQKRQIENLCLQCQKKMERLQDKGVIKFVR